MTSRKKIQTLQRRHDWLVGLKPDKNHHWFLAEIAALRWAIDTLTKFELFKSEQPLVVHRTRPELHDSAQRR
jgi:hypothetical protein